MSPCISKSLYSNFNFFLQYLQTLNWKFMDVERLIARQNFAPECIQIWARPSDDEDRADLELLRESNPALTLFLSDGRTWLPDGYSQIFRSYVFGDQTLVLRASGLWLHHATLQNLIPSFPWIAPPRPPPWRNPRKGRDQILPSGNL